MEDEPEPFFNFFFPLDNNFQLDTQFSTMFSFSLNCTLPFTLVVPLDKLGAVVKELPRKKCVCGHSVPTSLTWQFSKTKIKGTMSHANWSGHFSSGYTSTKLLLFFSLNTQFPWATGNLVFLLFLSCQPSHSWWIQLGQMGAVWGRQLCFLLCGGENAHSSPPCASLERRYEYLGCFPLGKR